MNGLSAGNGDGDGGVVFRDVVTIVLLGFVICVSLILPHVNAAKAAKTENDGSRAPGNVLIEAHWPDGLDTDVDLWIQGPGDVPVGYSNKSGGLFNLLRDDLGRVMDVSGANYETAYSRGLLPGEYTVNLHLYRNVSGKLPIPVKVVVSAKADASGPQRQLLFADAALTYEGQELTVFRFRLDAKGGLVAGSVHDLPRPLRGAGHG